MRIPLTHVHLWRIDLATLSSCVDTYFYSLSLVEKQRAKNLKSALLYERFVLSHGAMREILSRYLDKSPTEILLTQDLGGRPKLEDSTSNIDFNLSHSDDKALLAVAQGDQVGVDLEKIRSLKNKLELSARFFTAPEHQLIQDATEDEQEELFFAIWTAKEAHLKARGLSILGNLQNFSVLPLNVLKPFAGYLGAVSLKNHPRPEWVWHDFTSQCKNC